MLHVQLPSLSAVSHRPQYSEVAVPLIDVVLLIQWFHGTGWVVTQLRW